MTRQTKLALMLIAILVCICGSGQAKGGARKARKRVVMAQADTVSQEQFEEWLSQGAFRIEKACDVFENDRCGPALPTDESIIWGYRDKTLHLFSVGYTKQGIWIYTHWATKFTYDEKRQMLYMKQKRKGGAPETFVVHAIRNGELCCLSKPSHLDNPNVVCGYYVLRHLGEKEFCEHYQEWLNRGKKNRWEIDKRKKQRTR